MSEIARQDFRPEVYGAHWRLASGRSSPQPLIEKVVVDGMFTLPHGIKEITLSVYDTPSPKRWRARPRWSDVSKAWGLDVAGIGFVEFAKARTKAANVIGHWRWQNVYLGCWYYEPTSEGSG